MSYRYARPSRRQSRQGPGCLGVLLWLIASLLLLVAIYGLFGRPWVSAALGGLAADQLIGPAPGASDTIAEQVEGALPGAVAALPPGELVVSEQEANAFLEANPAARGPIERAQIRFTAGRAAAEVRAYGLSGVASAGLVAQNGRVVVVDPQIDGQIGLVLSGAELANAIAERLNNELTRQGRAVQEVRIEEGRLVLVTQ